jgi:holo-[acyl-carrier protein] synthase
MCDGVGTDIVSVPRIEALVQERGSAFLQRWFTAPEIAYCSAKAVPSRHFAARMAAKEAVVKALPFGWDGPLPWRWIEVVNQPHGAPSVRLSGELAAAATRAGVGTVRISMSHCDEYATAIATVTLVPGHSPDQARWHDRALSPQPPGGPAVDRQQIDQVLQEWQALRDVEADPELEAVRLAILLEDVLGITLSDDEIDLALLLDPDAVSALLTRHTGVR